MATENETIQWGFQDPKPIRSKEHREFLITTYNKDKCEEHKIKTMAELIAALKKEKK